MKNLQTEPLKDSTMPAKKTEIATQESSVDYGLALNSSAAFEQAMKMAKFLSQSTLIPKDYRGKPADCLIALQMAGTLSVSPFEVMQGLYVVHGRPSFSAKFAIALANRSGVLETRIKFMTEGKDTPQLKVTACSSMEGDGVQASFSLRQAENAGWTKKEMSYWKTDPEQMCCYRAALALIRRYCPEVLMGVQTEHEVMDLQEKPENEAIKIMNEKSGKLKNEKHPQM